MSRSGYVRDWRLPPGWRAQRDTSVLGDGGPPLFADPWGVLEPPGGDVTVAVLDPSAAPTSAGPTGGTSPTGGLAAGVGAHRRPPTLLLERRALSRATGRARARLQSPPPVEPGQPVSPGHRTVDSPHGPVALLSTRTWDAGTGPDVRVVAVVVPRWSRDAVVLTLTWDDESGMAGLERLAERLVQDLEIVVEGPAEAPGEPRARGGARTSGGSRAPSGEAFPPQDWVGTRLGGTAGAVAGRLTTTVRRAFGPRRFGRATAAAWVALGGAVAALALTGGPLRTLLLALVALVAVLLPVLLAWRSWTVVHGVLTDARGWSSPLPDGGQASGLLHYLVAAALLGAVDLGPTIGSGAAPWYLTAAAWVDVVAHGALVVLEAGRALAPRLRARREARRARSGGPPDDLG
ncbi:hypothetical protein KZX45_02575 [Georgenia sp. EYE_87]|uniref:hypothetical protein n=1 Tax=Georgenia sp. EYE_87 TaxID=2853448 RepID=UPI002006607D|nr:hypothetical protein [Georgenia sp. EYE_87]MCK6209425.1 hypothetical protein [Georgenia sp. EYE_87]